MNIFDVHRRTTSRIEPFHTAYLASCLKESPELVSQFWALATAEDQNWLTFSERVRVVEEDVLNGGKRVDIVLTNSLSHCLIAVEAKTTDSSVKPGQLDDYLTRLKEKYDGYRIWMTYLTPFNTRNKPKGSRGQEAIKEFQRFNKDYSYSSHMSWEEVVKLPFQGNDDVWSQHSEFVKTTICKPPTLAVGWGRLDDDLGWETMRDFWQAINKNGFESSNRIIKLRTDNDPRALASTIRFLLSSEKIRTSSQCPRIVEDGVKVALLDSAYGQFHQQIFQLLNEYPFLGIHGTGGYGLRIPVKGIHRHVSICTVHLRSPERLEIGRPPR